ncbi:MAG: hypothetical protein MHM6MM_002045 [Cercozoa sp. M6MM]
MQGLPEMSRWRDLSAAQLSYMATVHIFPFSCMGFTVGVMQQFKYAAERDINFFRSLRKLPFVFFTTIPFTLFGAVKAGLPMMRAYKFDMLQGEETPKMATLLRENPYFQRTASFLRSMPFVDDVLADPRYPFEKRESDTLAAVFLAWWSWAVTQAHIVSTFAPSRTPAVLTVMRQTMHFPLLYVASIVFFAPYLRSLWENFVVADETDDMNVHHALIQERLISNANAVRQTLRIAQHPGDVRALKFLYKTDKGATYDIRDAEKLDAYESAVLFEQRLEAATE